MSIAMSVIDAVSTEAAKYPGSRPSKVGLRIGELAAIDAASLEFCFEALLRGTGLEQLRLAIETRPRRHRCLDCATEFEVKDYEFHCPHCGGLRSEYLSGDELEIAYVEMEEHEPSPA